jgi:hypothetical protein
MRIKQTLSLLGLLGMASCSAESAPSDSDEQVAPHAEEVSTATQGLFKNTNRVLTFVAHQDDDFFNMTPDLINDIKDPAHSVQSIVFTAGDAGLFDEKSSPRVRCQTYIENRGLGQKLAWEQMAGVNFGGAWNVSFPIIAGKKVLKETMPIAGRELSIIYLGLANDDDRVLEDMWKDRAATLAAIPVIDTRLGAVTYTRTQLLSLLKQVIINFAPTHVNTMDSGLTWPLTNFPDEHTDHVHSALFALAAMQQLPEIPSMRMYRTYNALFEQENVAPVDQTAKLALYNAYAPKDPFLCPGALTKEFCGQTRECQDIGHAIYGLAEPRQYPIGVTKNVSGVIRAPGTNKCLRSNGVAAGSTLAAGACAGAPTWDFLANGTLHLVGTDKCVSANTGVDPVPVNTVLGMQLRLEVCNDALNRQRFALTDIDQLRGPDATCVSAANPNTLTLAECSLDRVGFSLNFVPPAVAVASTDFGGVPNYPEYYRTLTYGDLDKDGDSDVCIRRANGVWCALNNGAGAFIGYAQKTVVFSDTYAGGTYSEDNSGGTLQLADVDNNGFADLCSRRHGFLDSGIYCLKNTTAAIGGAVTFEAAPSKRTDGGDFGDWTGLGTDDFYYRSIHFVDFNNDGKLDVCGRNTDGIECALGSIAPKAAGFFAKVVQRTDVEFSDWLLWNTSNAGSTVQYADVDGDNKTDVCGRGDAGIICMLGKGSLVANQGFERPHTWSATDDFSNGSGWGDSEAYYGSIRLGDINGDGRADVCGRGPSGVVCGLSTGQAFARAKLMIPEDPFSDSTHSGADTGSSLALLRFNAGTHLDVCLRGSLAPAAGTGLRCAYGP